MTDKQRLAAIRRITNPVTMLKCIVENEGYFGFDPYYRDIRETVLSQAEKVANTTKRARRSK